MPTKGFKSITFPEIVAKRIWDLCGAYGISPTDLMEWRMENRISTNTMANKINPKKVPEQVRRYT